MSRARPVGPSRVAVVVVNYNGRHHLDYCLPSILSTAYEACDVIVVDNASTDGSAELVRSSYPRARLLASPTNRGWAGGNNLGIRQALTDGCSYVVLQNNDTLVDPRWLGAAVAVMDPNPRLGILGFRVLNEYRADEDPDRTVFQSAMDAWHEPRLSATAHVSGCAMFVRARLFEELGLFDERYFVFGEEDDFVRRALAAGYQQARIDVPVWHHHGGTWRRSPLRWSLLAVRNDIRSILKNESGAARRARLTWLLRFVARPRSDHDPGLSHFQRLRPSIWPVNVAILGYALLWNLVFLPQTLAARQRDYARVRRVRDRVTALAPTPLEWAP